MKSIEKVKIESQGKNGIAKHVVPLRKHPTNPQMATVELIKISLEQPPANGFTTSDIRSRLKVMDKLDALHPESTVVELDEAEHTVLVNAVAQVKWARLDRFIVEFEDSLK